MSAVSNQTDDVKIPSSLSIVIPAYNEENSLPGMIDTLQDWNPPAGVRISEILIVDDGSTDRTHDLARELTLNDPRIKVIKNDQNREDVAGECWHQQEILRVLPMLTWHMILCSTIPFWNR